MQRFKNLIPRYFLVLIFIASSWALFTPQFFRVHDYTHAGRIAEMVTALSDGHFPVRWVQNFGFGYGMPLFEFYGPLPFYVGAAVYWLGFSAVASIKILYLLANFGTLSGGYLLGRKFFGRAGGLLTAAALTLAPYRAVNLYVRGALSEAWAIMFFPWILLGVVQIFQRQKNGWLVLTLSLTGLFLSHNLSTLIFVPVLLLFIAGFFGQMFWRQVPEFFRRRQFRWRNFIRILGQFVGSFLLAIGLSAFYLFPAFLEKGLTQVEASITTLYFDYHLHFLYIRQFFNPAWGYGGSAWGVDDEISFFLGWGQLLAAGVFVVLMLNKLWLWLRRRQPIFSSGRIFSLTMMFGGLLLIVLYMSLLKSQWLWDQLSLLRFVQFPWRWLGVAIVFLSLLLGSLVWFVRGRLARIYLSLLLVTVMVLGSFWYFRPEKYLENAEDFYYTDSQLIRRQLSSILSDYVPTGMTIPPAVVPEGLIVNATDLPADEVEVLVDRTQEKLISTNFTTDQILSLSVADYPGWRVEIDNQRWNRQLGPENNLELLVPAGKHLVTVRFLATPIRQYSDWASLVSWLLLVMLLLPNKPKASLVKKVSA